MKLRLLAAAVAALSLAGFAHAQDVSTERGKLSYAIGFQIGSDFADREVDVDMNTVIRGIQDGQAERTPAVPPEQMQAAITAMRERMETEARQAYEAALNENLARSTAFLEENRTKQGVVVLPSGVQYRIIETGTGARATATGQVQALYRVSLSTGQEIANTYAGAEPAPVTLQVGEPPMRGLTEVLTMMPAGSRWEVFLPPDQALGNDPRSPIGPGQAVVWDLKVVSAQ